MSYTPTFKNTEIQVKGGANILGFDIKVTAKDIEKCPGPGEYEKQGEECRTKTLNEKLMSGGIKLPKDYKSELIFKSLK